MAQNVRPEITALASAIIWGNKGRAQFSYTEAAKILGCDKKKVGATLESAGILVKPAGDTGIHKKVNALDLAQFMYDNRISPLRGCQGA